MFISTLAVVCIIFWTIREWNHGKKKYKETKNNTNFIILIGVLLISLVFWFLTFKNHSFNIFAMGIFSALL